MDLITSPKIFQNTCWEWRMQGVATALVPTMGFFHDGHLSLMHWARKNADRVVVSLFVNPTQFGPGEDLDAYPHDLDRDCELAGAAGVDAVFVPARGDMYAPDHATTVAVPDLATTLCGQSRPVHFQGVATVVTKLLLLTMPTVAVFGQKDWQQLAIIRRLTRDLDIPVRIEGRPIHREPDGLAMSSRNVYLTSAQRAQAPELHKGLRLAADMIKNGCREKRAVLETVKRHYAERLPLGTLEYLEFADPDTMQYTDALDPAAPDANTLLAVAMRLGKARLIDNTLISLSQVAP